MAVAGSLTYDTKIDTSGYKKGLDDLKGDTQSAFSQIRNIVASLGIADLISSAFDTLKGSIDSAMKRIDTMDQFTRVMTAMTGSAEKADKALASIKDTVTGTAYGLDVAAMSAQKFVTSGMQLDKSTEQVKIWADAVAFYGDGTNETFENVTDALAKMVSKGKVEMDQLNRLTDAGIPAVQIYADMVGKSIQEVQDDLSNGNISTQEFLDGLQTAFSEGTNRFASITNAAKEAGASWSATFDNMKAAVTRGMQSIIESIDDALSSNGLPTMREMIADIGSISEDALKEISKRMPNILKTIKNLVPLVEAVGIGFVSWQIGKIIQDLVSKIKNANKVVTVFNGLMSANPVALVASAVIGLTTALVVFRQRASEEIETIKTQTEELQNNIDARNELQETVAKNISSGLSELSYYQNLFNELTRITDENGRVKEGYEDRALFITSTLSEAMGMEIELVEGTIQNYQELSGTFDDIIAKKKGMVILNAQEEAYTEAIKKQAEVQATLGESYAEIQENKEKINELEKEYQELIKDPTATKEELANFQGRIINLKTTNVELQKEYDKAKQNYEQYAYDIASYEDNMAKYQEGKYDEMVYQTYEYVQKKKEADTTELENLQSQLESQKQVLDTLKEMKKKHNTDIYDDQIVSAEQQIEALKKSIEEQGAVVDAGNQELTEKWLAGVQNRLTELTGKQYEFQNAGNGTIQMYINGIASGEPIAMANVETFVNELLAKFDKNAEAEQAGKNNINSFGNGVNNSDLKSQITENTSKFAGDVVGKLDKSEEAKTCGVDILTGLNSGLSSESLRGTAIGSMVSLANNLVKSFNDSLIIKSPSKLFAKQASYIPAGVAKGIDDNIDMVTKAINKMDDEMVNKMKTAVAIETGNINANAKVSSAVANNSVIQINATFDGNVEMDKNKVGRIITPVVTKTIKVGGIR